MVFVLSKRIIEQREKLLIRVGGRKKSGRAEENRTGKSIVEITAEEIEADADAGGGESEGEYGGET